MTFLPNCIAKIYRTTDQINPVWIGFTDANGRVIDAGGIPPSLSYGDYVITLDHCDYNLETLNFNIPRDTLLAATVGCTSSISTHEALTTTHGGVLQTAAMKNIASGIAGLDANICVLDTNLPKRNFLAGADIYHAHDAIAESTSGTYVIAKTITLNHIPNGTLRTSFILGDFGGPGTARIYRNGAAVGTERYQAINDWGTAFIENLSGWVQGDLLQLYFHTIGAATVRVKEFRILYNSNAVLTNS